MTQPLVSLGLLATCQSLIGGTLDWGSSFSSVNRQSDGVTAVTGGFTIQLGTFTGGVAPDGANVDLWASNWTVFDEMDPGEHKAAAGYYTSQRELLNNSVYRQGDQAYVWLFNSQTAVPGSEWLLYTNDATDGLSAGDWLFPTARGSQQTMPLSWRVSNATRALFGCLDPDGAGIGPELCGDGHGTPPPGPFNVQAPTFVPEPGAAMLGGLAILGLAARRRRQRL